MPRRAVVAGVVGVAAVLAAVVALQSGVLAGSPCRGEVSDPAEPPTHHDPELEERIPETVAGHPIEVQSFCANVTDASGLNTTPEFLEAVGVEIDDVTYALNNPSIGSPSSVSVTAYRYHGASEEALRAAYVDAMTRAGETLMERTLGGKPIHVSDGPLAPGASAYVAGDTLYFVSGTDGECADLLAQLP
jgi:hypothetical protein